MSGIVSSMFFGRKVSFVTVFVGCGELTVFTKEGHDTTNFVTIETK